tara:strand:+ start:261 stop:1907 length:1647 start_codon:yes stop_codon:yes gene_type:complete
MFSFPRYLTHFDPKSAPHYFFDVLIIGGGLAGLRAAVEIDPSLRVLVVTKDRLRHSSSSWAQGGIAGVINREDCFENHIGDTLRAGCNLCDPAIVSMVVQEAPDRIQELIRWGAAFDEEAGELALGKEGGHSHHRIVHANGDATGAEIMRAMSLWTDKLPQITLWEGAFTLDLLTDAAGCRGAVVARSERGVNLVWSKQTILCTGGAGQLYRETSNPEVATGDGIAAAYRAGAALRDMEFMQFHPTMLYIAGSNRRLITEAVRGEGARLIDNHGTRFMGDYDDRLELAPRDIVSHAIEIQMQKTRHPCVYLDLSHLDADKIRHRFPGITRICKKFDIDITSDPIPVRPGAHYFIGGVSVDAEGRTSIPQLWAAGEVTASGLHGANRLASNSLLESMVYGAHAGAAASQAALNMADNFQALPLTQPVTSPHEEPLDLGDIRNALKSLMWRNVGVRRSKSGLKDAATTMDRWCRYVLLCQFSDKAGWELQNMLTVAYFMIDAALAREETRGVHQRVDFPDADENAWRQHLQYHRSVSEGHAVRCGMPLEF